MTFTDQAFAIFLPVVLALYWLVRIKTAQNLVLLAASYLFYGFVHPWFCALIAVSTVTDYICGLLLDNSCRSPVTRRAILALSLAVNLGMLGVFKYFNFFTTSFADALSSVGWQVEPLLLKVALPVGISFYTFQTLSYTIDVYRGQLTARRNLIDFAVYVSCFPQLVAGPIERAGRFLPQIEAPRTWSWELLSRATPLFILGFFKKLVVADNLAGLVEQVYMLRHPSAFLLICGTVAFAMQILADFSAYTDIARGVARLLGFELMENFKQPYLAVTPSDFWRRWHISLSSWIRDYIYIPLGGSRGSRWAVVWVLMITFGLSGLWHGAQWHFVIWGLYHALLLALYHGLGMTGSWQPNSRLAWTSSWLAMLLLTLMGWTLFRSSSLGWLAEAVLQAMSTADVGLAGDSLYVGMLILGYCLIYGVLWMVYPLHMHAWRESYWGRVIYFWLLLVTTVLLSNRTPEQFIYFQF